MVLQPQHLAGDVGSDVRIAVAVTTDPGTEGQRAGIAGQRRTVPLQLCGKVGGEIGQGLVDELLQVVHGVACLVDRGRTVLAQLVGLPDQVDDFGQLAILTSAGHRLGLGGCCQHIGQPSQLAEDRSPACFGRMGREDRTNRQLRDCLRQL